MCLSTVTSAAPALYPSYSCANRAVPSTVTLPKVKAQAVPKGDTEEKENCLQTH